MGHWRPGSALSRNQMGKAPTRSTAMHSCSSPVDMEGHSLHEMQMHRGRLTCEPWSASRSPRPVRPAAGSDLVGGDMARAEIEVGAEAMALSDGDRLTFGRASECTI